MKTLFIGHTIVELDTIDSTNTYAINMLKEPEIIEGLVIRAHEQTNGKGQRGNTWFSEPRSNLTFSIILTPAFIPIINQFYLTKVISLGVADYMSELLNKHQKTDKVSIKWPNDIYINNKKVAGMLLENIIRQNKITYSVVGIGCNINQTTFGEDLPNATSLKLICETGFDLDDCLEGICSCIEARYLQLKSDQHAKIDAAYLDILYIKNIWTTFKTSRDKTFKGRIVNVSKTGLLQIEQEDGLQQFFDLKDVSMT